MPKILPSQIVSAIDSMFGASRNEIYSDAITWAYRAEVHALLGMLDEVPGELIDLSSTDYLVYAYEGRERRVFALPSSAFDLARALEWRRRQAGPRCQRQRSGRTHSTSDEAVPRRAPSPEPELPFIVDDDIRLCIEDRIQAAWTDFNAREWMGATVFAGAALEALLLR